MYKLLYPNVISCSRQKHMPDACVKIMIPNFIFKLLKNAEDTTPAVAQILSLKILIFTKL